MQKQRIKQFYISITNRCNLKCLMCTTGKGDYSADGELSTQQWIDVIERLSRDCDIDSLTFGGGEPLLRSDLAEIIQFACHMDISSVNLISNGTLLDKSFMKHFTNAELKKIGINISIDGLEGEHNFIRGKGVYQQVIKNFEMLYQDYFKSRRINNLTVSSVLMPENFSNYVSFLELLKKYEGVTVDIQPLIPNNEICWFKESFHLTEKEKIKLSEIVDWLKNNIQISTRPYPVIKAYGNYFDNCLVKTGRCLTGYDTLNITYDGHPYLCGKELSASFLNNSFPEIMQSSEYQSELQRIRKCTKPCLQGLHIDHENYAIN